MKVCSIAIVLFSLLLGCTKSKPSKSVERLPFESAIHYTYKKLEVDDNAAIIDGEAISWSLLRSNNAALSKLEAIYNSKALAFVYAFALMTLEKKNAQGAKVKVKYTGPQLSRPIEDIVVENGLSVDKDIEVELNPMMNSDLADVEGRKLTRLEFLKSNAEHTKLYKKIFNLRMQSLNGIVVRQLILKAAKKQNLNIEEYINKKVVSLIPEASESEVKEFARNRSISGDKLDQEMTGKIKSIIKLAKKDKAIEEFVANKLLKKSVMVSFIAPNIKK